MGLRGRLAAFAVGATHVLLAEAPGGWRTRVAVEHEVARRGWRLATAPADADALVVVGSPGPELLECVEVIWNQLPGPRSRAEVAGEYAVETALAAVGEELLDDASQARDARERIGPDLAEAADADTEMAPGGIPLAEGREDRDGLEMDVLHVPLGPVLPHWPAGLVLRCTLAGDAVVDAEARVLDDDRRATIRPTESERTARYCDQVADLLGLAGWSAGRLAALDVRDELLDEPTPAEAIARLDRLERRLRRSPLLRWSLRGIGVVDPSDHSEEVARLLRGDVYDRLLDLPARARAVVSGDRPPDIAQPNVLAVAERIVVGLDLAAARLAIASLDIDTSVMRPDLTGMRHG